MQETTIKLNESGIATIQTNNSGINSEKIISFEQLGMAFNSYASFESPLLPGDSGLLKYTTSGDIEKYIYVTPPQKIITNHFCGDEDPEDFETAVPYLIWFIKVRKIGENRREIRSSYVFSLQHQILSEQDTLYVCPLPNVFDNGSICWGSFNPQFTSVRSIQSIFTQFMGSNTNRDLEWSRFSSGLDNPSSRRRSGSQIQSPTDYLEASDYFYKQENKSTEEILSYMLSNLRTANQSIKHVFDRL
ncbi:hypothetical protein [Enterococcus sp. 4E1_DIV0656]|uniref:hypothetical protein n=1 Tax=unclassified Enterococcus TaxID=2608891 RepID=UPI000A367A02|nr:hypothetical protein [Enterococcus sp. 4E1_DIV0656]OTO09189.1 hypothetical protein A5882_003519 [Enterococcus sp. 4E1_DIV0656]